MKHLLTTTLLFAFFFQASAQSHETKKILRELAQHPQQDTFRVNRLNLLSETKSNRISLRDSTANEALAISKKMGYQYGLIDAMINVAIANAIKGNTDSALHLCNQAYTMAVKQGNQELQAKALTKIGAIKSNTEDAISSLSYYLKAEEIAKELPDKSFLAENEYQISFYYIQTVSDYPLSMEWILKSLKSSQEANCLPCLYNSLSGLAEIYDNLGEREKALVYYKKAIQTNEALGNGPDGTLLTNIGEGYRLTGKYPEAIKAYKESITYTDGSNSPGMVVNQSNLADVYVRTDSLALAFQYAFTSLKTAEKIKFGSAIPWIDGILARAYLKKRMPDSALYYAAKGYNLAQQLNALEFKRDNSEALAKAYVQKNDYKNAYYYNNLFVSYRDSMLGAQVTNKTNMLQFEFNKQKTDAQITLLNQQKELQRYFLIGALILVFLILVAAIILFRNNRNKQKANMLLTKQKHLIEEQRDQTKKAMDELQDTQKQLIQSEKMASLGELTAGIAHEIQNPLNFINNFSEVNSEMIDELKNELATGNLQLANEIADDIKNNEEKINHHGKRADAIVKGMLQHSRKSTGEKEPSDINALADEYLRLSYHGLRAKDKSFNATMETDFDPAIGKINVIPQEMGRVFLNLFNNAFYATNEKQKSETSKGNTAYKPTVFVSTQKCDGKIQIKVGDNGNGIPQKLLDKIYQPFFTTKPTGEGTGLGLSLSYDIVKVHHGTLTAENQEGGGAVFTVELPGG